MKTAEYWIEKLDLQKHPEGGWYREVYLSDDVIPKTGLPMGFRGERNFATSIYYLLKGSDFSAFHRIKSDEIWHYYSGTSAIELVVLEKGCVKKLHLGDNPDLHQRWQLVIPKNTWFAARLLNRDGYALAGCTVSPGFHFDDFELAGTKLTNEFPVIKGELASLVKDNSIT
jgi:uncharacterized protein